MSAVPNGVEQVLDNLIDNAIAASPPGARVSVTLTAGDTRHSFTVADEGPGMSDDLKARALDRFWRFDDSKPGSGLGLPIAQTLVEASRGSLLLHDSAAGGLAVTVSSVGDRTPALAAPALRLSTWPAAATKTRR